MSAKAFIVTSLLALASALPSSTRSILDERQSTECWQTNPGTTFYRCANGYVGCFKTDPCSLPPIPSATAGPGGKGPTTQAKVNELTIPRSYNIYPNSKQQSNTQDKVGHVDINKPANSKVTTTNAMVFDNVPAGAKNCQLKWRSTLPNDRNQFTVNGNGQAWHRQLKGWPTDKEVVSFDGLKKYQDKKAEWKLSIDFTGWQQQPGDHIGPSVRCEKQVGIELKGSDKGNQENRVVITHTETNGFYLTYDL